MRADPHRADILGAAVGARTKQIAYNAIAALVALAALGFALAGAGLLIWQVGAWLRVGRWPAISTADLLEAAGLPHSFTTTWAGVQLIVDCLFEQPASLMLWAVAGVLGFGEVLAGIRAEFQGDQARSVKFDEQIRKGKF